MRVILFILGMLFSADGLYCAATAHMGAGEILIISIGVIFILWSVFYKAARRKKFLKVLKVLFVIFMSILTVYSCVICVFGHMDDVSYNEDYLVVLGAGLNGDEPSQTLKLRLDKTVEYMKSNKKAVAIVSGGRGKGERVSEASAMRDYLINNGVAAERVLRDDNATSTYENFVYSKLVIDKDNVAFITSDFHVLRSLQMAKLNGIDAKHIGASTPITSIPTACAREFLAQIAAIRYY